MEIPIELISDSKGYLDRECPNDNCKQTFKVSMEDWKEKFSDEAVYCPVCGHKAKSDKWWTQNQLDEIQNIVKSYAFSYIQKELDKSFKNLENAQRNNKFFRISFKPGKKISFVNNPIGQSPEWEQDIQCPSCKARFSIIGTPYFCPCCGKNIIEKTFDDSMENIIKMIDSLDELKKFFLESYGEDRSESMCRSILEGTLGDIVSAFQTFAKTVFASLSEKKVRSNDFQMIQKGSDLFKEACGFGYDSFLAQKEINSLIIAFQKRHLFEHNEGIVDEDYLKKSGDTTYKLNERIILNKKEVIETIHTINKLSVGLKRVKVLKE